MSTKEQQTAKLNKKQRRKNARAGVQTNQSPDDEQEQSVQTEISVLTQNNHSEINGTSSATNEIQELTLNNKTQAENVDVNF
jgi:hypothetical protein